MMSSKTSRGQTGGYAESRSESESVQHTDVNGVDYVPVVRGTVQYKQLSEEFEPGLFFLLSVIVALFGLTGMTNRDIYAVSVFFTSSLICCVSVFVCVYLCNTDHSMVQNEITK